MSVGGASNGGFCSTVSNIMQGIMQGIMQQTSASASASNFFNILLAYGLGVCILISARAVVASFTVLYCTVLYYTAVLA